VTDRSTTSLLFDLLSAGRKVIFESGAGFLRPEEFTVHQRTLFDDFGLMVDSPVALWSRARAVPYVNYSWPCEALVRDFSRVVPVLAPDHEIIGRVGSLSVASKRAVENGLLIFIGSPLGPSMRAGDPESQKWLLQLLLSA
jgi:hypothetical protein